MTHSKRARQEEILFIRSCEELDFLKNSYWASKIKGSDFSEIVIEFPAIDPEQAKTIQGRLNAYYFECGCGLGSLFLVFTILLLIILAANSADLGWEGFVLGGIISITGALAGKVIGLVRGYLKLKGTIFGIKYPSKIKSIDY